MNSVNIFTDRPENYYTVEVGKDEHGSVIRRRKEYKDGLVSIPSCGAKTLYELWKYAVEHFPNNKCLGRRTVLDVIEETKVVNKKNKTFLLPRLSPFIWETYSQVDKRLNNFANGLSYLGITSGEFLCIFLETSVEWTISSHACYLKNITLVTSYENLGKNAFIYALNNTKVKFLICNATSIPLICEISGSVPSLEIVIYTNQNAAPKIPADISLKFIDFSEVESIGAANPKPDVLPEPDDLACIMYTSGSTGAPKGVLITHANLIAAIAGMECEITITHKDSYLSYLPLAHVMAFVVENVLLAHGAHLGYGSPRTLTQSGVTGCNGDISELSPTLFIAVPTIYERIQKGILDRIKSANFVVQYLFQRGLKSQLSALRSGSSSFWSTIIFNRFKEVFGGRLRLLISGSAPLSGTIQDFIRVCLGVPVVQGYGLTETTSCGSLQSIDSCDTGTIGAPFSCLEIKLIDIPEMGYTSKSLPYPSGEICIRGPVLCKGYYNDPSKTAESFQDSWFRTGDVGIWLPSGQLAIVDRIKNLIKPPHGEYISVEKLESAYRVCPFVESIMIHADSYHFYCVAIVVPSKDVLMKECGKIKQLKDLSWEKICQSPITEEFILEKLKETGKDQNLKSIEIVRAIKLMDESWTPQNSFLTAAMKLNRPYIENAMKDSIEILYNKINES